MRRDESTSPGCTIPVSGYEHIVLAHGGGGRLMHQLIDDVFCEAFAGLQLDAKHDSAIVNAGNRRLAFTTDSYVVDPMFFPGGDIGSLAVYGTVNDLAMAGARPLCLSAGFILEEGLPIRDLHAIARSMRAAAENAGVRIVTGDTKVVEKGKGHGVFINTSGIGVISNDVVISPERIAGGDAIIISGDIGRHGIAVMAQREGFTFETSIESDCAPLAESVAGLIEAGVEIHCLRDLTRGGLATALVELAVASDRCIQIEEGSIPVHDAVKGACEILGFDPLYVACEGRFVAFVAKENIDRALAVLISSRTESCVIGSVTDSRPGLVTMRTALGAEHIVDMMSGEQLPRIC
jgi:hydrogenase expression/formation protein HypE